MWQAGRYGRVVGKVSTQPKPRLTPEQYLAIERAAERKSDYFRGEMFAMASGTAAHNLIVTNILAELRQQLKSKPCRVFPSDMRVLVRASGLYTYPDIAVVCGEPRYLDQRQDTLLNPILIVEVLSPSTEAYDRGRKFEQYRSIDTLVEYMMVSPDRVAVDLFARQSDEKWVLTGRTGQEEGLDLQSVGCRLALREVYDKVELT